MPLNGQPSGGWTESSSSLRILHVGVRNTVGDLTDDAFTQTNPPHAYTATYTVAGLSAQVDTSVFGVLSGSVAFARPDVGSTHIGGPAPVSYINNNMVETFVSPLGCFINHARGYAWENQPGLASGKGPYVSAMGTYGNQLFEDKVVQTSGAFTVGDPLYYITGCDLVASLNGYLMPRTGCHGAGVLNYDIDLITFQVTFGKTASTTLGVLLMPADSEQNEIVYDQRV
jgi:hypothetical protein